MFENERHSVRIKAYNLTDVDRVVQWQLMVILPASEPGAIDTNISQHRLSGVAPVLPSFF